MLIAVAAAGLILGRAGTARADLRRSELRARHISDHDPLTGLPNRRAPVASIVQSLDSAKPVALLFTDLDGFKDANDIYGHSTGDGLLQQAAACIRQSAGGNFVARVGGDEFAVLCVPGHPQIASGLCDSLLRAFEKGYVVGDHEIRLGVSIGWAGVETLEIRQDELMRRADVAMYAAKAEVRTVRGYHPPSTRVANSALALNPIFVRRLRRAA